MRQAIREAIREVIREVIRKVIKEAIREVLRGRQRSSEVISSREDDVLFTFKFIFIFTLT
jgi:hypothetical protein